MLRCEPATIAGCADDACVAVSHWVLCWCLLLWRRQERSPEEYVASTNFKNILEWIAAEVRGCLPASPALLSCRSRGVRRTGTAVVCS